MTILLTSLFWLIILSWVREHSLKEGAHRGELNFKLQYLDALSKLMLKAVTNNELAGYLKALEEMTDLLMKEAETDETPQH